MAISGKGTEGIFTAARAMADAATHDSPAGATDPDNDAPAGSPSSAHRGGEPSRSRDVVPSSAAGGPDRA